MNKKLTRQEFLQPTRPDIEDDTDYENDEKYKEYIEKCNSEMADFDDVDNMDISTIEYDSDKSDDNKASDSEGHDSEF